jgi:CHAT domain-containing protein
LAQSGRVETLLGDAVTPAAVLQGIETSRVVHLCCHGSFTWEEPLDSTLTLAGRPITLREITLQLELSPCELIVLSACEAGSHVAVGTQDRGFAQVLLDAGCGAFIGPYWRVDDLASALLFSRFYEEWDRSARTAAAALCHAQSWLARQSGQALVRRARDLAIGTRSDSFYIEERLTALALRDRPYALPRFWGSFCVTERPYSLTRYPRASRAAES